MDLIPTPQQVSKARRIGGYIILGLLILAGLLFAYKLFFHSKPVTGVFTATKPADGMANAPTHTTPPVKLQAYDKSKAVKLMGIPEIILSDPKRELIGTGRVGPSEGGHTIGVVTNTDTGKTEVVTKEEPRPLFGFGGKTEVGALAGITTKGDSALIYVKQDVLRVGSVNLGAIGGAGTVGGDLAAGAFVTLGVRW